VAAGFDFVVTGIDAEYLAGGTESARAVFEAAVDA